jgi:Xaa-Pro aminopeptidase
VRTLSWFRIFPIFAIVRIYEERSVAPGGAVKREPRTDSRYTFQAREEVSNARIKIAKEGLIRGAGEALRNRRGRPRVAYNPVQFTVAQLFAIKRAASDRVRWVDGGNAVEKLRAVKDAGELASMREAAVLISAVVEEAL